MKSASEENLLDEVMRSLSESAELAGREKLRKQPGAGCGIVRSLSVRNTVDFADGRSLKPEQLVRPSLRKAEDLCFSSSPIRFTPGAPGKARSVKEKIQATVSQRQSRDCNPYATLPRASSVISTAEGSTRRTSIHDFLSKDSRPPVSVDAAPSQDRSAPPSSSEYPALRVSSPCVHCVPAGGEAAPSLAPRHVGDSSELPKPSRMERPGCRERTLPSARVFWDKASGSGGGSAGSFAAPQPFLSLNTELVSNISGLPPRPTSKAADQANVSAFRSVLKGQEQPCAAPKAPGDPRAEPVPAAGEAQSPLLVSEDNQTLWYEYGCVWKLCCSVYMYICHGGVLHVHWMREETPLQWRNLSVGWLFPANGSCGLWHVWMWNCNPTKACMKH